MSNNKITIEFEPTPKQELLFEYLEDDNINQILYGGAAGGGKSYGICAIIIMQSLKYKGIRTLIGRQFLSTLKLTTMKTFQKILDEWSLIENVHYTYNSQQSIYIFRNGSEVVFKDLFQYPRDPEFTKLGGLELTYAFIDEAGEISEKAKDILLSRIGRQMNKEYNLKPKIFLTCNPTKNFIYKEFYSLFIEDKLEPNKAVILATSEDNPHLEGYREFLEENLSGVDKDRLLYGKWDFNTIDELMINKKILEFVDTIKTPKYKAPNAIAADIARFGSDKTIIALFYKDNTTIQITKIIELKGVDTKESADYIRNLTREYNISLSNVVIDTDGLGAGTADNLKGCINLYNNGKAQYNEKFKNIKTQLYFRLANKVNTNRIGIDELDNEQVGYIVQELGSIKRKNIDDDNYKQINSKKEIKALIGRSPDYSDVLAYCNYWDKPTGQISVKVRRMEF